MRIALFVLLGVLPFVELALLIMVGSAIGFWWTLAIILGTGVLGIAVLMENGMSAPVRIQEAMLRGEPPVAPMFEAALVVTAGVLLVTPGLVADALGLMLLIPPLRRLLARWIAVAFVGVAPEETAGRDRSGRPRPGMRPEAQQPREPGSGPVIEGEFERLDERTVDPNRRRPNGQA